MSTFARFEGAYNRAQQAAKAAADAREDAFEVAKLRHAELDAAAQEFVARMRAAGFPGGTVIQTKTFLRPLIKQWRAGDINGETVCRSDGLWNISGSVPGIVWDDKVSWSGGSPANIHFEMRGDVHWEAIKDTFMARLAYIMEENGVSLK